VGEQLGIELTPTTAYDFANGEIFVRYKESVRGCDAFVLQSHPFPLNKWLMEQFIMVDALKRASPSASPSSPRSTATPARTRSTAAASRSRPG
jgi:phosphoribosylpyrophosphate synthetase